MLGLAPGLTIVDVSHAVEPGDVQGAAEILADLPDAFPAGTVHVAVVDPGVGSARPLVAFQSAGQMWVGPDNGVWGRVAERYAPTIVHQIENRTWWRERVSSTFHGRDILGPVAARLAVGWPLSDVGPVSHDSLQALPQRAARVGPRGWDASRRVQAGGQWRGARRTGSTILGGRRSIGGSGWGTGLGGLDLSPTIPGSARPASCRPGRGSVDR